MTPTLSNFLKKTLMPDEQVVKTAQFPWVYTFNACVILLFCAGSGYAVKWASAVYLGANNPYALLYGVIIGLFLFYALMMKKWTTEIILTNERLIYKRGFFVIQAREVDIEQLASDNVEQSFMGRIFDYGTIRIRCIEADDLWLPPIWHPYDFRNALEQQKHNFREHYMRVEHLRRHGSAPEDK
jgi:hypothetical protein